jgi:hypothetical protein
MNNYVDILKNCFLFENIDPSVVNRCCMLPGYTTIEYYPQDVMQDYKTPQNIGIIISGKATIISGDNGVIIRKLVKHVLRKLSFLLGMSNA